MSEPSIIEWHAPEYEHRERSTDWQWSVALGAGLIALILFYFGNLLFGLVIILAAASIILYARRPPQEITFALTAKGLLAGRELYPYKTIKHFSIPKDGEKLIIESSRVFLPRITIPIEPPIASRLRDELKRRIKEVEHEDHLLDTLADRLGI